MTEDKANNEAEAYRNYRKERMEREEDEAADRAARDFKRKSHEAAGMYSGTQQDKPSDFGETVRSATRQFDKANEARVEQLPKQTSSLASPPSFAPKGPSKQELKEEREREARAAKLREAEENAQRVRIKQEEAEKVKEFREIAAKNEARQRVTDAEQNALLKAKTGKERIAIRQQIEARQRAENERITLANAGKIPPTGMRPITPGTIKESFRKSVSRTPAAADRMVTGVFGNLTENLTTPQKSKSSAKLYKQESQQLSKALKPHAQYPVTGSIRQTPVVSPTAIFPNPNFAESLLGRTTKQAPKKVKQAGGLLSGLDNFARRL